MARSSSFRAVVRLLQQARRLNHEAEGLAPPLTKEQAGLTRRSFVKGMALAGVAGAFPFTMQALAAAGGKAPRIAIVGGGLAGLNAAYCLKKAGFPATVYEGSNRIGGRMHSVKNAVGDDLVIEMGAELVNTDHADILNLVQDFGLKLFDRVGDSEKQKDYPAMVYYFDGKARSEEEMAENLRPLAAQIARDSDLIDRDFDANAPALDKLSAADYLDLHKDKIPVPYIRTLLENSIRSEYGVEPSQSSALQLIYNLPTVEGTRVDVLSYSDEVFSVAGGSETIITALGKALDGQIQMGRELKSIRVDGKDHVLDFAAGEPVVCDFVILTIPFTVAKTLKLDAPLPDGLRRFIAEATLGANEKVVAGFSSRVWRDTKTFTQGIWSDQGYAEIWDGTQRQQDIKAGALTFFLGGDQVRAADDKGGGAEAGRAFVEALENIVPGALGAATGRYLMTSWGKGRFSRGAYATFAPGQLTTYKDYFWVEADAEADRQDVHAGNLILAGEHLSDEYFGFMNGAAQTGRLAADLVLRRLRNLDPQ